MKAWTATLSLCALIGGWSASAVAWEYPTDPGALDPPLEFTALTVITPDSARLASWFVPAQDSAGAALRGRRPGLLVLPGDGDTMDERLPLVVAMARRGFNVFTFDHRGRGASSAFPIPRDALVLPEFLDDAHAGLWVLWLRPEVDTTRVAVYGESRGAWLAFALAGERTEVRGIVAAFPPTGPKDWIPVLERADPGRQFFVPKGWKHRDDPEKVVKRFNGPIFFIAGDADLTNPSWMAEDLHRRYPRPKDLWVIEGAAHDGQNTPEKVVGPAYYDRIAAFLNWELAKPPHRGWPGR
jgi:pimeloyl-ACP methyl ester carboxylesterase